MATVPVTAAYAAQKGNVKGLAGSRILKAARPPAVQSAVEAREMLKYPSDLAVSGSKHSSGITLRISKADGYWSSAISKALPSRPERATPLRSCNTWGRLSAFFSWAGAGIIKSSLTMDAARDDAGRRCVCRCVGANADERGTPRASAKANE